MDHMRLNLGLGGKGMGRVHQRSFKSQWGQDLSMKRKKRIFLFLFLLLLYFYKCGYLG